MTETQRLIDLAEEALAEIGRNMQAVTDALFPGMKELREATARLGYQGKRYGWYPEKPKRKATHRRPI